MNIAPKDIEALKRRMVELKVRMDELHPFINSENIEEWVAMYNERESIEQQLGDDA